MGRLVWSGWVILVAIGLMRCGSDEAGNGERDPGAVGGSSDDPELLPVRCEGLVWSATRGRPFDGVALSGLPAGTDNPAAGVVIDEELRYLTFVGLLDDGTHEVVVPPFADSASIGDAGAVEFVVFDEDFRCPGHGFFIEALPNAPAETISELAAAFDEVRDELLVELSYDLETLRGTGQQEYINIESTDALVEAMKLQGAEEAAARSASTKITKDMIAVASILLSVPSAGGSLALGNAVLAWDLYNQMRINLYPSSVVGSSFDFEVTNGGVFNEDYQTNDAAAEYFDAEINARNNGWNLTVPTIDALLTNLKLTGGEADCFAVEATEWGPFDVRRERDSLPTKVL